MKRLMILTLVVLSVCSYAQDHPEWSVVDIKDDLKTHADIVVRKYDLTYKVVNSHKAIKSASFVKTILNSHGSDDAFLVIPYDDFRKIKKFDALILDAKGTKIDKVKNSDIIDYNSGGNSIDDTRVKVVDLSKSTYPYTIVVDYEVEFNTNFYSPTFAPQHAERVSVENASFTLSFNEETPVKFKSMNLAEPSNDGGSFVWNVSNLKAIEEEDYSPDVFNYIPVVLTSPNSFVLDNSKGSFNSWKDFGKWYYELNQGRDQFGEEDRTAVINLLKDKTNEIDKVRAIYHYMQEKTRYVSVQLGIGGYQSMPAQKVSDVGWGDCKALTNYTQSMLKAVGIVSYPALVNSGFGANRIMEDFPSNQFDHVILCVPLQQDTVWLECTSREMPFNFLGDFTDDRKVLLVTPGGGKLIKTPLYSYKENLQSQSVEVWFDKAGQGKAIVNTTYRGLQFDDVIRDLDESDEKLKKIGYSEIDIPNFTIDKISFEHQKDQIKATRHLEMSLRDYATKSGQRVFLKPNLMNRQNSYPKLNNDRKIEVVTRYAYTDIDTIKYHLPEGYYFEYMPKDIHFEGPFGTYDASFKAEENGFIYIRKLEKYKGTYPKESYNDLVDFLKKMKKADNTKVVLTSST